MATAANEGRYAASQLRDAGGFKDLDLDDQDL
jgi:hypothetical protein